jgi:DNA ligase-1
MDSNAIFEAIESVAATSSKTGKEQLIAQNVSNPEFSQVLVAALDPFVRYGMANVPWQGSGEEVFSDKVWNTLEKLANRNLTGNAAQVQVKSLIESLTPNSAELLKRIITKDLRAGFGDSTVNKAVPGLIPTFDCMLAHKFEEKRVTSWPVAIEAKLDGVRVLTIIDLVARTVDFFSRSGKPFTTFDHLKEGALTAAQSLYDNTLNPEHKKLVLDSEVVSGSFNKTVSEVRRSSAQAVDAVLYVFDIISLSQFNAAGKGVCSDSGTYAERRELLCMIRESTCIKIIPAIMAMSLEQVHNTYKSFQDKGLEGAIVKDLLGLYSKRRSYAWMKLKAEETLDLPCVGSFEGTGKYVNMLGGLVVDFNGIHVNVGSGFSDEQRKSFWELRDELPGRLVEVGYHEVTPDLSLRHPRYFRFRDDKQQ